MMDIARKTSYAEKLVAVQEELRQFLALSMPFCAGDVDDVLQETNLALLRKESQYDSSRSFRAWALRFAALQLSAFRKRKQREKLVFDEETVERAIDLLLKEERSPAVDRARLAICRKSLSKRQADLIRRRYDLRQELGTIARETGSLPATVKVALFYARRKLAACVRHLQCTLPENAMPSELLAEAERGVANALERESVRSEERSSFFDELKDDDTLAQWIDQAKIHYLLGGWSHAKTKPFARFAKIAASAALLGTFAAFGAVFFASEANFANDRKQGDEKMKSMGILKTAAATVALASAANAETPDRWLDYVEGAACSAVKLTGATGRSGTKMEAVMSWSRQDADGCMCGSFCSSPEARFYLYHSTNYELAVGYATFNRFKNNAASTVKTIADGEKHTVVSDLQAGDQTVTINGKLAYHATAAAVDTGLDLYLFAIDNNGNVKNNSHIKLYSFKLWQDGELKFNLRPCLKDNVAGLYNEVDGTILYSSTTYPLRPGMEPVEGEPDLLLDSVMNNGLNTIDTGVKGKGTITAEGVFSIDKGDAWSATTKRENCLLGAGAGDNKFLPFHIVSTKAYLGYGKYNDYAYDSDGNNIVFASDTRYTLRAEFAPGTQKLIRDGETLLTTEHTETVNAKDTLFLFGRDGYGRRDYVTNARCHGCKIWNGETLVRDFVPCMKDGRAGLWDKVENKIYFGWSELIPGRRLSLEGVEPVDYLEYIETDGSQYIDTGVLAASPMQAEADIEWNSLNLGDNAVIAARAADKTRLIFFHSSQNKLGYGYNGWLWVDPEYPIATETRYLFSSTLAAGTQTISVNGTTVYNATHAKDYSLGLNLYLLAGNVDGVASWHSNCKLYRAKIWQNGELVRDFRPVSTSIGVNMLYDKVEGKLYNTLSARNFPSAGRSIGKVNNKGTVIMLLGQN